MPPIPFLAHVLSVIDISPSAITLLLNRLYRLREDISLYFYKWINPQKNTPVILSTQDIQIISAEMKACLEVSVPKLVDRYNGDIYNDITMLLCLQVPHQKELEQMKQHRFRKVDIS